MQDWRRVLVGGASVAVVLLGLELVLRAWIVSPSTTAPDHVFGYFEEPYSRQVFSREGWFVGRTNSMGLFDEDLRDPPAPWRVLLIGDSFAEAKHVTPDRRFSELVESDSLEVCNAARSNWSPADMAAFVVERGHLFEANVILVQYGDEDLEYVSRPHGIRVARDQEGEYQLEIPRWTLHEGRLGALVQSVRRKSALLTFMTRRIQLLGRRESQRLRDKLSPPRPGVSPTLSESSTEDPLAPLVFLHEKMAEHCPRIVYLYTPGIDYTTPEAAACCPDRRAMMHQLAARTGAPLVDPTEVFLREYRRTRQPLHGFHNSVMGSGHVNGRGHELLAGALREVLQSP